MATSSKFDPTSSSPDRPLYTGQRGSHITASLDRPGSFRESMENPMLSSLPNMSRSSSSATHGDVVNFFNNLPFDSKFVAEHKSNRQRDYKQHVNVALGISPDESPSSSSKGKLLPSLVPEEIKRLRDSLEKACWKARERGKMFTEALHGFHKVFPGITTKKRSRAEGFSSDRSAVMLSDRPVLGSGISKVGVQGHAVTGAFELEQQKPEERTKNLVPNKRTRTSMTDVRMDVRTNPLVRPSGTVDREKEMPRIANIGAVQGEERTLPIGGDGWEKSKMKKKRSCIKLDGSPITTSTKPVNTFQETKQGMQQRLVTDSRSKLSNDSHSFRGVSNGTVGAGKSDGISQQPGMGIRASTPRNDPDNNSVVNERRGRPASSDKEKGNFRAVNKATVRDEFNSASPTSSTKMNTSIRAPRSGSGVAPKLSPVVHRAAVPNDWELSHCTTKPPAGVGTNNRKRVASARSSSPPVVHWQRPQKSSRTARRTNFGSIASNNDEATALDAVPDVAGNDGGLGFARRLVGSSQQIKLKCDPSSSAALSESEESGMAEVKPKEKSRKPEEVDQKAGQNIQKVSNLVLPTRKNKLISGEEQGDGVRRQGRTGRSFTPSRSPMSTTSEKLGNIGTAKQLRSARLEKNESRAGRPPTRKLSDRKAYARQKPSAVNAAADFLVGSEDGHEELLAAVKAVINSARAFSSPFWKQMEPLFGLISEEDITYWKQKENLESSTVTPTPAPVLSNIDGCETVGNGYGLNGCERDVGPDAQRSAGIITEQLQLSKGDHNSIPLCERLLAALISEEDCSSGSEDFKFDAYDAEFEPDGELELSGLDHRARANSQLACHSAYNGYRIIGNPEHDESESDVVGIPSTGLNSSLGNSVNGLLHDKASRSRLTCSELQYDGLDINDKILLELQSVGIVLDSVPEMSQADDEGILEDIARLEEHYQEQVSKKKGLIDQLLKSASVPKELQEKDFEQHALEKLIVMAYEKYMAPSGGRNSSNKMAKQAALGFVKRTLERCHQFEDTGKSCFTEPLFKDMFLAASSQLSVVRHLDGMEAESAKPYATPLSLEARTASMGSQQSPSQFSQNTDNHDLNSSDMLPAINHSSEQNCGKEDLWSNRVKKRELALDDVGGTLGTSAPGIGNSLTSSARGKRSERDRDGKGHSREVLSRNGTTKVGRPASSSAKGERKSKTKPKQKSTQHSVSVNGLLGKLSEQPKPSGSKPNEISTNSNAKEKDEFGLDDHEPIDLSNLQLPGIDVLGGPDDLTDHGQDLGSWLNIDDDGLQDHDDFMGGLEIPMDDLSDLNMMV